MANDKIVVPLRRILVKKYNNRTKSRPGGLNVITGWISFKTGWINFKTVWMSFKTGAMSFKTGGLNVKTGWINFKTGGLNVETGAMSFKTVWISFKTAAVKNLPEFAAVLPVGVPTTGIIGKVNGDLDKTGQKYR